MAALTTQRQSKQRKEAPLSPARPSGTLIRSRTHIALHWLLALIVAMTSQQGHAQSFNEYQVKAVFLFNFAQFVEWPANNTTDKSPFIIGVLGDDPFDGSLDEIVHGELVNNRPFQVRRYRRGEPIDCDILFVGRSEAAQLPKVLAGIKGRNILTVGDTNDFARRGGIVEFVTENKRVHLKINVNAAKAANITISSKLLRPAEIVASDKG